MREKKKRIETVKCERKKEREKERKKNLKKGKRKIGRERKDVERWIMDNSEKKEPSSVLS